MRTVRSTPHISPGKKPAIIASGGKLLHSALGGAVPPLLEVLVAVVLAPVEVRLGLEIAGALDVALLRTHWLLLLQLYPGGQHVFDPQVWRSIDKFKVCIGFSGKAVALSCCTSHPMGNMVAQSLPGGQHIADWPPLNGIQVVEVLQQKLEGRPWPHAL